MSEGFTEGHVERCGFCGALDLSEMIADRTGEVVWLCGECDSLWRSHDDRSGSAYSGGMNYVSDRGTPRSEFHPVDTPPAAPAHDQALGELRDLIAEGRLRSLRLGVYAGDARALVGPWGGEALPIGTDHWVPETGPVRLHIRDTHVVEMSIVIGGGPLPMPGLMDGPGPDFSLVSPDEAEWAIEQKNGFLDRENGVLKFDTGAYAGEINFVGRRPQRIRIWPAPYPTVVE